MKHLIPVSRFHARASEPPQASKKRALPRVLCIVGPTASGKTSLGITLAKEFHGEVINADARQIYRYFSIGTGKPLSGASSRHTKGVYRVYGVPHHLMDYLSPKKTCTVAEWRRKALRLVRLFHSKNILPVVVGGTGLYIQALVDNYQIPSVPPHAEFRAAMEKKSLDELVALLLRVDPEAVRAVDLQNRRRVLRALEVVTFTGQPFSRLRKKAKPAVDALLLGVARTREDMRARIRETIALMVKRGWVEEVERLHKKGIPWHAPAMSSIGYREIGAYLRKEFSLEEAMKRIEYATWQYAKRQITWFKRDPRIHWVKTEKEAEQLVGRWLDTVQD